MILRRLPELALDEVDTTGVAAQSRIAGIERTPDHIRSKLKKIVRPSAQTTMQSEDKLSDAKRLLFNRYLHGQIPAATSIQTRGSGNSAPLSPVQEPLYRREMEFQGHPALYNECITIRMQGPLDPEILERSFNEIIRRHEAWRTTFETRTGQPVQVIHPPTEIRFSKRDLRDLPEGEREAEANRLAVEDIRRPFQLSAGPLLRPTLIRMGEDEHRPDSCGSSDRPGRQVGLPDLSF